MGFGHRVYKTGDPRAAILKTYCRELAREVGDDRWERIAEPIEQAVTARKKLPPNVDWPSARLYHYMGLPVRPLHADLRHGPGRRLGGPHASSRLDHNRLMRPRGRYIGPPHRRGQADRLPLSGLSGVRGWRREPSSRGESARNVLVPEHAIEPA